MMTAEYTLMSKQSLSCAINVMGFMRSESTPFFNIQDKNSSKGCVYLAVSAKFQITVSTPAKPAWIKELLKCIT